MEQHQRDVEEVFRRLKVAGLVINFEKLMVSPPFPAESLPFRSTRKIRSWR
jgi:hypothetical protein